jgi:ABC-type glycerol-3-phosphate transport system permease component
MALSPIAEASVVAPLPGKRRRRRIPLARLSLQAWALVLAVLWLLPFWLLMITPMKSLIEYTDGTQWTLPKDPLQLFTNLKDAWNTAGLGPGFLASLLYGTVGAGLAILFGSLGAYAIARLRIRWGFAWFVIVFSGTIFPFQMYLIPLFRRYVDWGLYDTRWGLIGFYTAIAIPFCLFVMRGFFVTIAQEQQDAARLDGASDFSIYWRIFMPQALGPIAVLFLFQFTWIWNDLVFGLVLATSDGVRPIMPSLLGLQGTYAQSGPPLVLAAALIGSLPTVVLFLLLGRHLLRGLVLQTGRVE